MGPSAQLLLPGSLIRSDTPPSRVRSEKRGWGGGAESVPGVFQKARPQRLPSPDLSVSVNQLKDNQKQFT